MSKIIGLVGFIGAGKGTVAEHLEQHHGFIPESFARSLKDATSSIFGWDRAMLEGDTVESREWREIIDPWWADRLGIPSFTPRLALQLIGTNVCRDNFHQDIWIASLEHRLINTTSNIVISDVRFKNELEIIKKLGGTIIRTKRGPEPDWFIPARVVNNGPEYNNSWDYYKRYMDKVDVHPSEWGWIGGTIDYTIENDGTKENLHHKVDEILTKI